MKVLLPSMCVCRCRVGRPADVSGHAWGPFSLQTRQALLSAKTASVSYCQPVRARACSHLAPGTVLAQWPDAQFSFTPSPTDERKVQTYGQFNTDIVPQYRHVSLPPCELARLAPVEELASFVTFSIRSAVTTQGGHLQHVRILQLLKSKLMINWSYPPLFQLID